METRIYKARVIFGREFCLCDAIEHEGKLWLVPKWLEKRSEGWRSPARIIRFDNLEHTASVGSPGRDYLVHDQLPSTLLVFDGRPAIAPSIEVVEAPLIRFAL
jgi:hypothetical protein